MDIEAVIQCNTLLKAADTITSLLKQVLKKAADAELRRKFHDSYMHWYATSLEILPADVRPHFVKVYTVSRDGMSSMQQILAVVNSSDTDEPPKPYCMTSSFASGPNVR
jgi:hypothetical protein